MVVIKTRIVSGNNRVVLCHPLQLFRIFHSAGYQRIGVYRATWGRPRLRQKLIQCDQAVAAELRLLEVGWAAMLRLKQRRAEVPQGSGGNAADDKRENGGREPASYTAIALVTTASSTLYYRDVPLCGIAH